MTVPAGWPVTADMVALWLKLDPQPAPGTNDAALLELCASSATETAQRYRADCWDTTVTPPVFAADAEVQTAAIALGGRLYRRRNSPAGIETFSDSTLYVSRFDPEIERALHMAGYLTPTLTFGGPT